MDQDEIKSIIKNELKEKIRIRIDKKYDYYENYLSVSLIYDGEEISESLHRIEKI